MAKKMKRTSARHVLRQYFREKVSALLNEVAAASGISHRLSRGQNREEILRQFLTDSLPRRFQVGTGEVVDSQGKSSGQHDIIIADALYSPVIQVGSPHSAYAIEAVHCVIEVQSIFWHSPPAELAKVAKRFLKLMKLTPKAGVVRYTPPSHVLLGADTATFALQHPGMYSGLTDSPWRLFFCWRGPAEKPKNMLTAFHQANEKFALHEHFPIDAVVCLTSETTSAATKTKVSPSSGYVLGYTELGKSISWQYRADRRQGVAPARLWPKGDGSGKDTMSYWFSNMLNYLNGQAAVPPNPLEYFGFPYHLI